MSHIEIVEFYNQGAQVRLHTPGSGGRGLSMKTFTGGASGKVVPAKVEEIGYEPKANSKPAKGASHDILERGGKKSLLLKSGHAYDVIITHADGRVTDHTISAEVGHIVLPLPHGAEILVSEHKPAESTLGDDAGDAGADQE